MKNSHVIMAIFALAGMSLLAGCVERTVYVQQPPGAPPAEVVVNEPPPPPQVEVAVAAPGPGYVWIPGCWEWRGHWVWVGGRWVTGPHRHAVWVPGHYYRHGHGYVWVRGYWR